MPLKRGLDFPDAVTPGLLVLLCIGFTFAGARLASAQEAASANLPDQFQTGEKASTSKPKKEKDQIDLANVGDDTQAKHRTVVEQVPAKAESSAPIVPSEENQKPTTLIEQQPPRRALAVAVARIERNPRPKRRCRPAIQPEGDHPCAPVLMPLSVAQSMAIRAPLPEYACEAKGRDLTGSGVCVITVDPGTGEVTDASMERSTGDRSSTK
jgi:hypothetical protein